MTTESTHNLIDEPKTILNKEYKWSWFVFSFDIFSFTSFNILITLLILMHSLTNPMIDVANWIIYVVAACLEVIFIGFSAIDSYRSNPNERLYGSRIFNLPVYVISVIITLVIFWNNLEVTAITYGAICGGFAGYLAGGLAYANFFIKIKDLNYRIIFGGWVGVSLGAVFGALFAGLMNYQFYIDLTTQILDPEISDPLVEQSTQLGAQVFSGIFMGFWGGAIASGAIATILLHFLRDKKKFTFFFTKLQLYDIRYNLAKDLKDYFANTQGSNITELNLSEVKLLQERELKKPHIIIRIFREILYFISPWEKPLEKTRIDAFKEIIDKICEEKNYDILEEKITLVNQE